MYSLDKICCAFLLIDFVMGKKLFSGVTLEVEIADPELCVVSLLSVKQSVHI